MTKQLMFGLLLLNTVLVGLGAQQLPPEEPLTPEEYSFEEFPVWAHDLRRFEVITIGTFPITFFATSLIYDFSIYAANDFNANYSLGTQRDKNDIAIIMGTAAGVSVLLSSIDLIINISKRKKAEKEEDEQRRVSGTDP